MSLLNRQPGKLIEHSLEELKAVARGAIVTSSDDQEMGQATQLHVRTDEINPAQKLYQYYFRVARPIMGNAAYVPADFIEIKSADQLRLTVTSDAFEGERWDVAPTFIAVGNDTTYDLP
ncbi:MAG: hypothetical protein AAF633_19450 [Chloroflexota bacterium]